MMLRNMYLDKYYVVIKKATRNSLRVNVNQFSGECVVSVPKYYSDKRILGLINGNKERIIKYISGNPNYGKTVCLDDGDRISFWGRYYKIYFYADKKFRYSVGEESINIYFRDVSSFKTRLALIQRVFKEEVFNRGRELLNKWLAATGLTCSKLTVSWCKSKWGSCNREKKIINLNSRHAFFPVEFLDLTVIHEVLHLKIANHGKDFKDALNGYYPSYRTLSKRLDRDIKSGSYVCF